MTKLGETSFKTNCFLIRFSNCNPFLFLHCVCVCVWGGGGGGTFAALKKQLDNYL